MSLAFSGQHLACNVTGRRTIKEEKERILKELKENDEASKKTEEKL